MVRIFHTLTSSAVSRLSVCHIPPVDNISVGLLSIPTDMPRLVFPAASCKFSVLNRKNHIIPGQASWEVTPQMSGMSWMSGHLNRGIKVILYTHRMLVCGDEKFCIPQDAEVQGQGWPAAPLHVIANQTIKLT